MGTLVKMSSKNTSPRRGRLPVAERDERRHAVLDATEAALLEDGYDKVTMLAIARRAGASKETLYSWFGNRVGLFTALIERSADRSSTAIDAALGAGEPTRTTLTMFATGLLSLLSSPASIALNRAAMQSPELSAQLLASGRHRVGPLVERYLGERHAAGEIVCPDPAEGFELLYGLVIRDTQIRVLLGEPAPERDEIRARAATAVDQFFALLATD